jgi:hypothetical protein
MTVAAVALPRLTRKAWTPCWENLNKLEWVDGFTFVSHGVHIGVRVNNPELLPLLRKRLPPGATRSSAKAVDRYFSVILGSTPEGSRVRYFSLVYGDHTRLARSVELDLILDAFESWVRLSVGELSPTRVFVHAGAVGWKGRAILVPGKSFSSKTSLVIELVKAGATYYSDEFAVLDAQGRVHPFLLAPAVREKDGSFPQRALPIEEIGGWAGSKPLPVGLVVLSEYAPGGQWRPRRLSAGPAALALLSNTVSARRSPERALAVLERVTSQAPVLMGKRGEAQATARAILAAAESGIGNPPRRSEKDARLRGTPVRLVAVNDALAVPAPVKPALINAG